jgi:hypothetical protein
VQVVRTVVVMVAASLLAGLIGTWWTSCSAWNR